MSDTISVTNWRNYILDGSFEESTALTLSNFERLKYYVTYRKCSNVGLILPVEFVAPRRIKDKVIFVVLKCTQLPYLNTFCAHDIYALNFSFNVNKTLQN